jgi:predicted enzyme related to lactoylglutathione lyase
LSREPEECRGVLTTGIDYLAIHGAHQGTTSQGACADHEGVFGRRQYRAGKHDEHELGMILKVYGCTTPCQSRRRRAFSTTGSIRPNLAFGVELELGGAVHVPPKEIPNISRISIAVDPQMATIALLKWLDDGQEQPAELDALGRVGWHELLAADWEKAFAFYRELFGWQKAEAEAGAVGTYQLFSVGGQTIGGMFTKPAMEPVPFWLYYFNVGDIDVAMKRVKAGGGTILEGPIEVPGSRIVRCTDPQAAIFALMGKRSHNGIGYFERLPSRNPSSAGFGVRR